MKILLTTAAVAALIISTSSCKKCYDCTTVQTVEYSDPDVDDALGMEQSYVIEKCDRKKNVEEYENENTATVTNNDSWWGEYTSKAVTTCVKN